MVMMDTMLIPAIEPAYLRLPMHASACYSQGRFQICTEAITFCVGDRETQ